MRSYLAFKGMVVGDDGVLLSPTTEDEWQYAIVNGIMYPALIAGDGDLERDLGIFASTYSEAEDYSDKIFVVAPAPELVSSDDDDFIVIGEEGWRARAAIVLGEYTEHEAANLIVASYKAGYPQIDMILLWAFETLGGEEAFYYYKPELAELSTAATKEERDRILFSTIMEGGEKEAKAALFLSDIGPDVLMAIVKKKHIDLYDVVAKHPAVTEDVLIAIIDQYKYIGTRYARSQCMWAIKSPYVTEKVLLHSFSAGNDEFIYNAAMSPAATERVLMQCVKYEYPNIQFAALCNKNATERVFKKFYYVRRRMEGKRGRKKMRGTHHNKEINKALKWHPSNSQ